jgi:hypothetical protein
LNIEGIILIFYFIIQNSGATRLPRLSELTKGQGALSMARDGGQERLH